MMDIQDLEIKYRPKGPSIISELMETAYKELIRLDFRKSARQRYCSCFHEFMDYCSKNSISHYDRNTGRSFFYHLFQLDIGDCSEKMDEKHRAVRCSVRFLDDIYQFGYARRNLFRDYHIPLQYDALMSDFLDYCRRQNNSEGTARMKRAKICQFLCFLEGREIPLEQVTASELSEYMVTLAGRARSTCHSAASALGSFFQYLDDCGLLKNELWGAVPRPKIYAEETIPMTWKTEEVEKLLSAVDRTSGHGKRDYAMILMAVMLGMRAGDICRLKFKDFDWKQKTITYTQQKTHKVNTLPLLPQVGEAVIDYIKNGRLESGDDHVFIRHIFPYGEIASGSILTHNIKRYMGYAGLKTENRKGAHSLRHTLASVMLSDGTPLMTISDVLGHESQKTTAGYTKVDIQSLRQCALSYGGDKK